ncbi:MAG: hypothetical protein R2794_06540 [Chitinophagales bacterium]
MKKWIYPCTLLLLFISAIQSKAQCVTGNCENGSGTYKWASGDMYVGEWLNGYRTGEGRYDWADGSYYVGSFKNNLLDGKGAYYGADGTKMVGTFVDNVFQGEDKGDDTDDADYDDDDYDWGDVLEGMDADARKDSIARAETMKRATYLDLCSAIAKLEMEFPSGFQGIKGEDATGSYDFVDSWYSTLMVKNSSEAKVTDVFLSDKQTYYCILGEGMSFDRAKAMYDEYAAQFLNCKANCCIQVYDTINDADSEYPSYKTYKITFLTNDGYDYETYKNMVTEIELMDNIIDKTWEVILRVSYLE